MNAQIKDRWVQACSTHHLIPLLAYLNPPVIVGMGKQGWMSVRQALRLMDAPKPIGEAAGNSWMTPDGRCVFAVGHCSQLGIANRSWFQQLDDWRKIGAVLSRLSA